MLLAELTLARRPTSAPRWAICDPQDIGSVTFMDDTTMLERSVQPDWLQRFRQGSRARERYLRTIHRRSCWIWEGQLSRLVDVISDCHCHVAASYRFLISLKDRGRICSRETSQDRDYVFLRSCVWLHYHDTSRLGKVRSHYAAGGAYVHRRPGRLTMYEFYLVAAVVVVLLLMLGRAQIR